MKTTVDEQGRIQLGLELQAELGVKPGDEVVFESHNGQWVISPVHGASGVCAKGNVLVHYGICAEPDDELVGDLREERLRDLSKGLTR